MIVKLLSYNIRFGGRGRERELAQVIRSVAPLCAGVHLMALGWESHIPEILRGSGLRS